MSGWLDWGYWGVFVLMMLENVVPPIPSEAIMGVAGILVAKGKLAFVPLVLVGTAGAVLGNLFWWEIGRRLGYERLKPVVERSGRWLTLEWEDVERIRRYFDRWGGVTVFAFRFLPFGRTAISIPAGMMHMPFARFVLFTFLGSAIWNTLLVGVGLWLGTTVAKIEHLVAPALIVAGAVMVLLYVWRVLTWKPRAER